MQLGLGLGLDSAAFGSATEPGWTPGQSPSGTPVIQRVHQNRIRGGVKVVLFDFDGTLTATPGDRAERKYKIEELTERAPMLEPWLIRLREAGMMLGIISKSSENTIIAALEAAGMRKHFNGPVLAKAVGLERKAGFIEELCTEGALDHLGPDGLPQVLLVDDDLAELRSASDRGIQTYSAPEDGGLQDDDFHDIFLGLGLPAPARPKEVLSILKLWTAGITGESLGHFNSGKPQVEYLPDTGPVLNDYYDVVQEDLLGKGAFGTCRPAVHKETGRRAAMKIMRLDVVGKNYIQHFIEDDYFTFQLMMTRENYHPNVIGQLDYFVGPKLIYNAQDLLEGQDLGEYLRLHAPITELFAQRAMQQVLSALQHIHVVRDVGLIHRDVKLENLRFRKPDARSDLVLLDFGLATSLKPSADKRRSVVGTQLYMAPEVYSHYYNEKTDIWSFGVVLYIILTGGAPWMPLDRTSSGAMAADPNIVSGEAIQIALDNETINTAPAAAVELLRQCLLVDPQERPAASVSLSHPWITAAKRQPSERDLEVGPLINVKKLQYTQAKEQSFMSPKLRRPKPPRWELEVDVDGATQEGQNTPSAARMVSSRSLPCSPAEVNGLGTKSSQLASSRSLPGTPGTASRPRQSPLFQRTPAIPEAQSQEMEGSASPGDWRPTESTRTFPDDLPKQELFNGDRGQKGVLLPTILSSAEVISTGNLTGSDALGELDDPSSFTCSCMTEEVTVDPEPRKERGQVEAERSSSRSRATCWGGFLKCLQPQAHSHEVERYP